MTMIERHEVLFRYKNEPIKNIAKDLNRNADTVNNWLIQHGFKKRPRYTEMENYIILNFNPKSCSEILTHKTLNAIKIKRSRLLKKQNSI